MLVWVFSKCSSHGSLQIKCGVLGVLYCEEVGIGGMVTK